MLRYPHDTTQPGNEGPSGQNELQRILSMYQRDTSKQAQKNKRHSKAHKQRGNCGKPTDKNRAIDEGIQDWVKEKKLGERNRSTKNTREACIWRGAPKKSKRNSGRSSEESGVLL